MGFAFAIVCAAGEGAVAGSPALGVVEQFQHIQHHGDALAFRLGDVADDSYLWTRCETSCIYKGCKHYQGLARMDVDGMPYFFLTRSGAYVPGAISEVCGRFEDNPGELVVVQMASRARDGERLRSNRLWPGVDMESTLPPEQDKAVAHLHFSEGGGPGWVHPGGVQIVDGVLAITMQDYCDAGFHPYPGHPEWGVGSYECMDVLADNQGGLVLVDVHDPLSPTILHEFRFSEGYGAVAVTREPDGRYLFALSDPGKDLAFWRSKGDDLLDPELSIELVNYWDPAELAESSCSPFPGTQFCVPDNSSLPLSACLPFSPESECKPNPEYYGWWGWQSINFVRDVDGDLYLVAADNDNTGEPIYVGEDWIRLFKVTRDGDSYSLSFAGGTRSGSERRILTEKPQMGNVKAASGVYVSPTGQLIFYTAHHNRYEDTDQYDPEKKKAIYLPMGEFRNIDVHVSLSDGGVPPLLPVLEEVDVDGDGHDETSCSGWVELYDDVSGWDDNDSPHGARMFDFRDRDEESWNDLGDYEDFNDAASAVRWNLPSGQKAWLYWDANYEPTGSPHSPIELTGRDCPEPDDARRCSRSDEDIGKHHPDPDWKDKISSVLIGPVADPGGPYAGAKGTLIPLDAANPCYEGDASVSFEWKVDSGPCGWDDTAARRTAARRPSIECDEEGIYPVSLTVKDDYGNSAEASVEVGVANTPPIADAGPDQVVGCMSPGGATTTLDGTGSFDPDGDPIVEYVWTGSFGTAGGAMPTLPFPVGTETVSLVVYDDQGAASEPDTLQVTVQDTVAPEMAVKASPGLLWPPNGKMVPVRIKADATDTCDPAPICRITDVSSSEGRRSHSDWQIEDDLSLELRAKRKGRGSGRIYTVGVECVDSSGNRSMGTTEVLVPHDQSKQSRRQLGR